MQLKVKNLLTLSPFDECSVLTGSLQLTRPLSSITVMDVLDIDKWSRPHEAIIIGHFFEEGINPSLLESLNQRECSCIITKDKFVPFIGSELIDKATELGLPILSMPDKYSWSEIMNPINEAVIRNQRLVIERNERFLEVIVHNILSNPSFVGMSDAVSSIFEAPLAFLNSHDDLVDGSSNWTWVDTVEFLKTVSVAPRTLGFTDKGEIITAYNLKFKKKDLQVVIYPIANGGFLVDRILLIVPSQVNRLTSDTRFSLCLLEGILKLKCQLYKEAYKERSEYKELFLKKLLSGQDITLSDRLKFEHTITHPLAQKYVLAQIVVDDKNAQKRYYTQPNTPRLDSFLDDEWTQTDHIIVGDFDNKFYALLPHDGPLEERVATELLETVERFFSTKNIYIGISDALGIDEMLHASKQADEAISIAMSMGSSKRIQTYNTLGFFRLFTSDDGHFNSVYCDELIQTFVEPLLEYDHKNRTDLIRTLNTYIHNGFSIQQSASDLFIHANTLRARIKRASAILNLDLTESDNILNLQIALRLHALRRSQ